MAALRNGSVLSTLRRCLRAHHQRPGGGVIHYSVQHGHLHLIVEAGDRAELSRRMQGLCIRFAKALNKLAGGRRGKVFADRYHARRLGDPTRVRSALAYVLLNHRRHACQRGRELPSGPDRFSSGWAFDGWRDVPGAGRPRAELARPTTWLLQRGWRRAGLISVEEVPGAARARAP